MFDKLLEMYCKVIDISFSECLVKSFNCNTLTLTIDGNNFKLSVKDFKEIMRVHDILKELPESPFLRV